MGRIGPLSIEEIQQENLKVLLEFAKICDLLSIDYYLAYGTLIGAMRNQGFIPWDDDVDVWLLRNDFEVFKEWCLSHEADIKPFRYICRENTENYQYYIPRLTNLDIVIESDLDGYPNPRMGSFIDIYPLDGYCAEKKIGDVMERKIARINDMYSIYINGNSYSGKKIIKMMIHYLLRAVKGNRWNERVDGQIERILSKYHNGESEYVGVPTWEAYYTRYPLKWFDETCLHEFAGHEFKIPKMYDEILSLTYGDYMTPRSKSGMKPRHHYNMYRCSNENTGM